MKIPSSINQFIHRRLPIPSCAFTDISRQNARRSDSIFIDKQLYQIAERIKASVQSGKGFLTALYTKHDNSEIHKDHSPSSDTTVEQSLTTKTMSYENGDQYKGDFLDGAQHGRGILTFADGDQYIGDFQNNTFHGHGILTYANGNQYKGNFQNGKRHGHGILTCSDGERYEGDWIKDWPGTWKENENLFTFTEIPFTEKKAEQPCLKAIILQSTSDHNATFGLKEENPEKLSEVLRIGGYENQIVFFNSSKDLKKKIENIKQKVNLVWIRAHGCKQGICCGHQPYIHFLPQLRYVDIADEKILSNLDQVLTKDCSIVLEACKTGKPNMLAQKILESLCAKGINPTVIAPNGSPRWRGVDLKALKNEELKIPMITIEQNVLKDVATIFKRSK